MISDKHGGLVGAHYCCWSPASVNSPTSQNCELARPRTVSRYDMVCDIVRYFFIGSRWAPRSCTAPLSARKQEVGTLVHPRGYACLRGHAESVSRWLRECLDAKLEQNACSINCWPCARWAFTRWAILSRDAPRAIGRRLPALPCIIVRTATPCGGNDAMS